MWKSAYNPLQLVIGGYLTTVRGIDGLWKPAGAQSSFYHGFWRGVWHYHSAGTEKSGTSGRW